MGTAAPFARRLPGWYGFSVNRQRALVRLAVLRRGLRFHAALPGCMAPRTG